MKLKIAVDFDGVIHRYSKGWHDGTVYDPPMPGCYATLKRLKERGHKIIIFTTRGNDKALKEEAAEWLKKHKIPYDTFHSGGKPPAHVYLDDRALRFTEWEKAFWDILQIEEKEGEKL